VAFGDLQAELRGCVPKLSFSYSRTLVNRAWRSVRESHLWSFNLFQSSLVSPQLVTAGTVTTTQGTSTIQFDATALAALNASSSLVSLLTQRQFRPSATPGISGIYSLITFDTVLGVATLDRPMDDLGGTGIAYSVYQAYYAAPMSDFLRWVTVRNLAWADYLDLDMTRQMLDEGDPQRTWVAQPTAIVALGTDQRPGSATLGWPMFELWGQPISPYTYQCYGLRRGTDLVNQTDTLPPAIDEALVLAKARYYAYEWAEANKDMSPRSSGPDFRFLMGAADSEYKKLLIQYRRQDKELVDNYYSIHHLRHESVPHYSTLSGTAGPA
jgi:hypothetical protein